MNLVKNSLKSDYQPPEEVALNPIFVSHRELAAPTYFEPAKVKSLIQAEYALIEGGVFVNNPALCA